MNIKAMQALRRYHSVDVQAGAESASPHRLIQMLMEGVMEKIAAAKGHMARGEIEGKGRQIGWAISIVDGLRASLDAEHGGEVAGNLDALYDYAMRRLLEANVNNDAAALDEVAKLIGTLKQGWDGISEDPAGRPPGSGAGKTTAYG